MPITLPPGFLTRPEAAKLYNRSQRALERELDPALALRDEKVLVHWKLITKDGQVREALDVTTKVVKQLVADGMTPTWCVETAWLEEKYGRKGEERPRPLPEHDLRKAPAPFNEQQPETQQSPMDDTEASIPIVYVQKENEFLKERIRILEREKREEIERNEKREAKLFAQLEVKDRQISAWDEITQGITKALVTGQIAPSLSAGIRTVNDNRRDEVENRFVEADPSPSPSADTTRQGNSRHTQPAAKQKSTAAAKPKQKSVETTPAAEMKPGQEVDFFSLSLPTFAKLIGRKPTPKKSTSKKGFLPRLFT